MQSNDKRSQAQPPTIVDRLPESAPADASELASSEIERRRALLFWGHGDRAVLLAGQEALAIAYARIAELEAT